MHCQANYGLTGSRPFLSNLYCLLDEVTGTMNDGMHAVIFHLNFRKRCDLVNHRLLLIKLKSFVVRGQIYQWVKTFLTRRGCHVRLKASCSVKLEITGGFPQGLALGSLLFLPLIKCPARTKLKLLLLGRRWDGEFTSRVGLSNELVSGACHKT